MNESQGPRGSNPTPPSAVVDALGQVGMLEHAPLSPHELAWVRVETGEEIVLWASDLLQQDDGSYRLDRGFAEAAVGGANAPDPPRVSDPVHEDNIPIPLVEEHATIGKRTVVSGGVRIVKRVNEREETVDVPVRREELEVRRIPVGRWLEKPVGVRKEGSTLIVPVLEEVAVVEKRLMLKEELHIVRHICEERTPVRVSLRSDDAQIERMDPPTHWEGMDGTAADGADTE